MSDKGIRRELKRALRNTSEPALSAKQLADKIDVSVKTVHNHISDLVDEGAVETTQIGNATAYYDSRLKEHPSKVNHQCNMCGRSIKRPMDMAKLEIEQFFNDSASVSSGTFLLLCRFCFKDVMDFVYEGNSEPGPYTNVHSWNITDSQLRDVQEDPDIGTTPTVSVRDEHELEVYDVIDEITEDRHGASIAHITGQIGAETDLERRKVRQSVESLYKSGWLERNRMGYKPATDASRDDIHPADAYE
jgi:DNA-binding transcriptional ArsR family regulator